MKITGENPIARDTHGIRFATITEEVATEVVKILENQGIIVSL